MRHLASALAVGLVVLGTAAGGCRDATEIVVEIHTDVPCASGAAWRGTAFYAGTPGVDVESRAPSLTTRPETCDAAGRVGSVVVVPSDVDDTVVGIRVVAGITRPAEECAAANYDGCIVARRTLSFLPHQSVKLSVDLTANCVGQPCSDSLRTCLNGSCVDPRASGSGVADAPGPTVHCGDNNLRCPAGDVTNACCVTPSVDGKTTTGRCAPTTECTLPSFPLLCDKASDCAANTDDAGASWVCCLGNFLAGAGNARVSNSACLPREQCDRTQGFHSFLCEDKNPCFGTLQCKLTSAEANLPNYYHCDDGP